MLGAGKGYANIKYAKFVRIINFVYSILILATQPKAAANQPTVLCADGGKGRESERAETGKMCCHCKYDLFAICIEWACVCSVFGCRGRFCWPKWRTSECSSDIDFNDRQKEKQANTQHSTQAVHFVLENENMKTQRQEAQSAWLLFRNYRVGIEQCACLLRAS